MIGNTTKDSAMKNGRRPIATSLDTPFESLPFLNRPRNERIFIRSEFTNLSGCMVGSMRLASFAVRAAFFSFVVEGAMVKQVEFVFKSPNERHADLSNHWQLELFRPVPNT